tara:strand:- start:208 stop:1107 length:900 start_codon:yes stop_codon:yes gene_type:complete
MSGAAGETALFVGNLSWATTDEMLGAYLESLGCTGVTVSIGAFRDGRPKGFALVSMSSESAPLALDGTHELDGRRLQIRADRGATPSRRRNTGEDAIPSATLHIANLSWETTDEDLHAFFMQFGEPSSATVAKHTDTLRSKGWGLVTFIDAEAAGAALVGVTAVGEEARIDDRPIRVKFDGGVTVQERRKGGGGGKVGREDPIEGGECSIIVANLPWSTTEETLLVTLASYGVVECAVAYGHDGRSRGYARATTNTPQSALDAIAGLNGFEIEGRPIKVRFDRLGASKAGEATLSYSDQ